MTSVPFNTTIPASGNNPSIDQPVMQTNNSSLNSIIIVDHVGFSQMQGGCHQQVQMPNTLGNVPSFSNNTTTTPAGEPFPNTGTLYTKGATSIGSSKESALCYTPDTTETPYQLTRTINSKISLFGTNTNYNSSTDNNVGGWTFLPGNLSTSALIYNYGTAVGINSGATVVFPVPYSSLYTVVVSMQGNFGIAVTVNNALTTSFQPTWVGTGNKNINWFAIGV